MQIVSLGNNFHEMPKPIFWENNTNNISLSSAEFADYKSQFVVKQGSRACR